MKVLFIENRFKTFFWKLIAQELAKDGHEIFWLIQNISFKPNFGQEYILPYFREGLPVPEKTYTPAVKKIISSNRGFNYFNIQNDDFIFHYQQHIKNAITEIGPDVIFGESTLFHELLACSIAESLNILYLHPTSARYPVDRFVFYQYDTVVPFGGGDNIPDTGEAKKRLEEIASGTVQPAYMKMEHYKPVGSNKQKLTNILAYYKGEKYNTPSPFVKQGLEKVRKSNIQDWEAIVAAKRATLNNKFVVLYPLHMQPEANIDVWGNKYRDQTALIAQMAEELDDNAVLLVKPNPKSKYELTADLLDLVKSNDKIIPLGHTSKMKDVLQTVNLVVTVNGTIAIECSFKNMPVVTLTRSYFNDIKNCLHMQSVKELKDIIELITAGKFPKATTDEMIRFYQMLATISYKGLIGDITSAAYYVSEQNIENVNLAFRNVLETVENERISAESELR